MKKFLKYAITTERAGTTVEFLYEYCSEVYIRCTCLPAAAKQPEEMQCPIKPKQAPPLRFVAAVVDLLTILHHVEGESA